MVIVEFIQKFSHPILDWIMRILTEGGDAIVFISLSASFFGLWIRSSPFV